MSLESLSPCWRFVEGDINAPTPLLDELETFGCFESTQHLIAAYLALHAPPPPPPPSANPPLSPPILRPIVTSTNSAPTVDQTHSRATRRSRPIPPVRPLSFPALTTAGESPVAGPRGVAKSTTSIPGFLRGIRTNSDSQDRKPKHVIITDLHKRRKASVPSSLVLVTDTTNILPAVSVGGGGPNYSDATYYAESPSSSTSYNFPSTTPFSSNDPRRRSAPYSFSTNSTHGEDSSGSSPTSTRQIGKQRFLGSNSSESRVSDEDGDADGEGTSSSAGGGARSPLSGSGGPISPTGSKWARAFKLSVGGGGNKKGNKATNRKSFGSETSDSIGGGGSEEGSTGRRSFEVLHRRRPVAARTQSAHVVEMSSGSNLGSDLHGLSTAASTSTPSLGRIMEQSEEGSMLPRSVRRAASPDDVELHITTSSTSNTPTPVPSPSVGPTPTSTPRGSRALAMDYSRLAPVVSTSPPPSLLSASRPLLPSSDSQTTCKTIDISLPRDLLFSRRRRGRGGTTSSSEESCDFSSLSLSSFPPMDSPSTTPPTPDLIRSSYGVSSSSYRLSRSASPTALKRSTGATSLARRRRDTSDSNVSLSSTRASSFASSDETEESEVTECEAGEGEEYGKGGYGAGGVGEGAGMEKEG
ncbi:hypothetical protein P7C70_g4029, partial [Phenoliferia sp. Uapishka_3]